MFSDDGITPTTNPVLTNGLGVFNFYVADGRYDLQITGSNISSITVHAIEIADVTQAGPGTGDAPWQTDMLQFGAQVSAPTPPAGFTSLYSKTVDSNLYYKTPAGIEIGPLGQGGGGGGGNAAGPNNSVQINAGGNFGGGPLVQTVAIKPGINDSIQFVSVNGNDNNDGLSWGSAKATIYAAMTSLPGGGSASTVSDNFNRANGPVGSPWVPLNGFPDAGQVLNNNWTATSPAGSAGLYNIAFGPDQFSQATLAKFTAGSGNAQLFVRGNATTINGDVQDDYQFNIDFVHGLCGLFRGNRTVPADGLIVTPLVPVVGDVYKLQVIGNVITAFRNGVQLLTFTDTNSNYSIPGAGPGFPPPGELPGLAAEPTPGLATDTAWDSWSAGTLGNLAGNGTIFAGPQSLAHPTAGVGIWLMGPGDPNYSAPPAGWVKCNGCSIELVGIGATTPGIIAGQKPNVPIVGGSAIDRNHPSVWLSTITQSFTMRSVSFSGSQRPIVIGECSNNVRTGACICFGFTFNRINATTTVVNSASGPTMDLPSMTFGSVRNSSLDNNSAGVIAFAADNAACILQGIAGGLPGSLEVQDCELLGGGIKMLGNGQGVLFANNVDQYGDFVHESPPTIWFTAWNALSDGVLQNITLQNSPSGGGPIAPAIIEVDAAVPFDPGPLVLGGFDATSIKGPATVFGNSNYYSEQATNQYILQGKTGLIRNKLFAETDVARRIAGFVPVRFQNLAYSNNALWASAGNTITTGQVDPFGGTGAARLHTTVTTGGQFANLSPSLAYTPVGGDWLVFGVWVQQFTPFQSAPSIVPNTGTALIGTAKCAGPVDQGDGEWAWQYCARKVQALSTATTIQLQVEWGTASGAPNDVSLYGPVMYRVPAGTQSDDEVLWFAQAMASHDTACAPGSNCNTAGHPLQLAPDLFANLGTPPNGTITYCQDCASTNPCTGSGTGAIAERVGNAWNCSGGSGGSNQTASDAFTRGNGSLGPNWVNNINSLQIVSNAVIGMVNTAWNVESWNPASNTFTGQQFSQATVVTGGQQGGVGVFWTGSTGYTLTELSGGVANLIKWVGGSPTVLASSSSSGGASDVLRLEAVPNAGLTQTVFMGYQNGTVVLTYTDSASPITSGQPGIAVFANLSTPAVSNWSGGNFTVPGGGSAVTSVFGRTGVVVAATNDYNFNQLAGNIGISQIDSGIGASSSTFLRGDNVWAVPAGGGGGGGTANSLVGPGTISGTFTGGPVDITDPGTFNQNSTSNFYVSSQVNGCNPQTQFQAQQGGNNTTDALNGCVTIPANSGTPIFNSNAVSGYTYNNSTTVFGIGGYFGGTAGVTGAHVNALNSAFIDNGFAAIGYGLDVGANATNVGTVGGGVLIEGDSTVSPPQFAAISANMVGGGQFSSFLYQNPGSSVGYTLNSDTNAPTPLNQNDFGTGHAYINFYNGTGGALGMQQGWTTTPSTAYFMQSRDHHGSNNSAYGLALNPLGGTVTVGGTAGVFTTGQMNESFVSQASTTTAINLTTEYQAAQGANYSTDALTGGLVMPSGATVHGGNAVAGYANTSCNSSGRTVCNTVAGYFQSRVLATGGAVWGINPLVQDTVGISGANLTGGEFDINVNGTPAYVVGNEVIINGNGTVPAASYGYSVSTTGTPKWNYGYNVGRGATNSYGVIIDGATSANNVASQKLGFIGYDSGGTGHAATLNADSGGGLVVNAGANIIYRCTVAGTLRAGQLTSVAADCGTAVDTGLRTN